jgi:Zn-dependent M28 family amino/carboxypeptidase
VREGEVAKVIESAPDGTLAFKLNAKLPAPRSTPLVLRNVAGMLPGSDPVLKDTYVLVTGHYDHVGVRSQGEGDRIYNGANDDASGTSAVIDIAAALAAMNPRPKRSILFIALFGEELGLLGSQYYGRNPIVPLNKTIANVNFEQLGRTDSSEGPKIASASFTGHDYSDLPRIFQLAGEHTGITVYKDEKRSDAYFSRSDNQALADVGIPSHTVGVAFEFPDYHGVGDEWHKLDYDNMAKVTRMLTLGVIMTANSESVPRWNEAEPKAAKYLEAWKKLNGASAQ